MVEPTRALRVHVAHDAVTLQPGQPAEVVELRIANLSGVVDEFVVWVAGGQDWLQTEGGKVRVLPEQEGTAHVELSIAEGAFVRAGTWPVELRTLSSASGAVEAVPFEVTVPVVQGETSLALDPTVVRGAGSGSLRVIARNTSNATMELSLHATDPEGEMSFTLVPDRLVVPAREANQAGEAEARLEVSAQRPLRDEERRRTFTVEARGGDRPIQVTGEFVQSGVLPPGRAKAMRAVTRVLLTIGGALLLLAGAFRPWNTGGGAIPGRTGLGWNYVHLVDLTGLGSVQAILAERAMFLLSVGALVCLLAGATLLGLLGRAGLLTRFASAAAIVLGLGFTALLVVGTGGGRPASGVWLTCAGGVAAFVGGSLTHR